MRFDRRHFCLIGLAAILLVVACQPLPRPFKPPPGKGDNPLLDPGHSAGVHVLDVDGAPRPVSERLAAAMSEALLDVGIPASTTSANNRSLFLQGHARPGGRAAGRTEVDVVWDLLDITGKRVGRHAQRASLTRSAWDEGDTAALAAMASRAAPAIAALAREPAPVDVTAAAPSRVVRVGAVTGAPGDGNRALPAALRTALSRAGVALADGTRKESVLIGGRVETSPARGGLQDIAIVWTARDAAGTDLGTLEQRNAIAPGALDGEWGEVAHTVAEAAAGGVVDLLRRLRP